MIHFTEDHQDIRDMVADFSDQELAPAAEALDEGQGFPSENLAKLAELGMLGVTVPEEFGGTGADSLTAVLLVEELARSCGSTAAVVAAHIFDATHAVKTLGSPEQKARWLPGLATGETLGTFAIAEESAESDAGALGTRANRAESGWSLDGGKRGVVNGQRAGFAAVVARTGEDSGSTRGLGLFAIEGGAAAAGVGVAAESCPLGMRGAGLADWRLDGAMVAADGLLGAEDGFPSIAPVLEASRLGIAAVALGLGRGAITYALGYASERKAFGRSIDRFGAIRSMVAEAATGLEGARLLVYRAATLLDQGSSVAREISMAKLAATRAAYAASKSAVQILGGNGYSREYPVERMFRDAECAEVLGGSDSLHRMLVARALIGESR
jgi:alkylation response protein AidB-like acyl-CoA dehydrogenase